jgi:hypothetical protein
MQTSLRSGGLPVGPAGGLRCAHTRPQPALPRLGGGAAALCAPPAAPTQLGAARVRLDRAHPAADTSCQASKKSPSGAPPPPARGGNDGLIGSAGLFALWAGLAAYAFFLAPNQTPLRDQYFIEKFVGLTTDPVPLNPVFTQLFYAMGLWPLIYTALLVPAGRSGNGVPAWPFFTASYAIGAFGLLPFMALWQPPRAPPALPPAAEELRGPGNLLARGMESPLVAWGLLAGGVACAAQAAAAGGPAWAAYFALFQESRLVHVTTLDFLTLSALAPFWMDNDAQLRGWEGRGRALAALSVLPVLGPALYLVLRPKAGDA